MYPAPGTHPLAVLRVGGNDRKGSPGQLFAVGHRGCHAPLPALRSAMPALAAAEPGEIPAGDAPASHPEPLADPGQCRGRADPRGRAFPGGPPGSRGPADRRDVRVHVARHGGGHRPVQGATGKRQRHRSLRGRPPSRLGAYRRLEVRRQHAAVGHVFGDLRRAPRPPRPLPARGRRRGPALLFGLPAVLVPPLSRRHVPRATSNACIRPGACRVRPNSS